MSKKYKHKSSSTWNLQILLYVEKLKCECDRASSCVRRIDPTTSDYHFNLVPWSWKGPIYLNAALYSRNPEQDRVTLGYFKRVHSLFSKYRKIMSAWLILASPAEMTNTLRQTEPHVRLIYKSLEMGVVGRETYLSNGHACLRWLLQ